MVAPWAIQTSLPTAISPSKHLNSTIDANMQWLPMVSTPATSIITP
jgi:hypothetical protein